MIRLALRQFRAQAIVAAAGLAVVGVVLAITGVQLANLYDTTVGGCGARGDCASAGVRLIEADPVVQLIGVLLLLLPAVIGIFWGAPLVAGELETGTYRLAWTQGVSRTRWITVKLGVVGLACVVATGLLSLMVTWWFSPIDRVAMNQYAVFDQRAIVPIGYAAFAFVLGVTVGSVSRRTLPAMAITATAFVVVRLAMLLLIAPNLFAPAYANVALSPTQDVGFGPGASGVETFIAGTPSIPNAWALSSVLVDENGQVPTDEALHQFLVVNCPQVVPPSTPGAAGHEPADQTTFDACIARLAAVYHLVVAYQPPDRYWAFQWSETAIFAGLALVLAATCVWWVRRRLS